MPSSPDGMRDAILANLAEKTGRDAAAWLALARDSGLTKRNALLDWLKHEYGLSHVRAQIVAEEALKPADFLPATPAALLAAQYAGARAGLRPIYGRVAALVMALGDDVTIAARQTYISFVRGRQFGVIQPTTASRVDVGVVLPGTPPTARLQPAGSFGSGRVTHRVALSSPADVDAELAGWLKAAWAAAAG